MSSISTDRNPHFRLKTLDFLVYSTSFQGPEIVLVSVSSPTPLCLSSGPQYLYLGMLQSPLNSSSQVFTLIPLIHHTHCYYQFHHLVSHLLTYPTLLKPAHSFNLLTAVVSYVAPRMKSCPETPVCQLGRSRLFSSHQERFLDHCPSVFTTPRSQQKRFWINANFLGRISGTSEIFSQLTVSSLFPICANKVPSSWVKGNCYFHTFALLPHFVSFVYLNSILFCSDALPSSAGIHILSFKTHLESFLSGEFPPQFILPYC